MGACLPNGQVLRTLPPIRRFGAPRKGQRPEIFGRTYQSLIRVSRTLQFNEFSVARCDLSLTIAGFLGVFCQSTDKPKRVSLSAWPHFADAAFLPQVSPAKCHEKRLHTDLCINALGHRRA